MSNSTKEEGVKVAPEVAAMATLFESAFTVARKHMEPMTSKLYDKKQLPWLDAAMEKLEAATGMKRENIMFGASGFLTVYFIVGSLVQIVCNIVGFLYPAWCSIKAVRSPVKDDDTQWLIYWIVFAFFSIVDFSAFSAIPFYWLAKVVFLMYLYLPSFKGANIIYKKYIDPTCSMIEGYFTPQPKKSD